MCLWLIILIIILVILLDFWSRFVFFLEAINPVSGMAIPERLDVIFERSLVLEVGAAGAVPELAAVLLVGSPVPPHRESLAAFPAHERLDAVLPLVMSLQGSEILERFGSGMVDVVPAAWRAAVARQPEHRRRLRSPQRLRPFPVLRSVTPHMHLHIKLIISSTQKHIIKISLIKTVCSINCINSNFIIKKKSNLFS